MILLDTHVLSALLRPHQEPLVVQWLNCLADDDICTSAYNMFELRYGIDRLPAGKRRTKLRSDLAVIVAQILRDRIIPFDATTAAIAASLRADREKSGKPIDVGDMAVASAAMAGNFALATRNIRHFADTELHLINPWTP